MLALAIGLPTATVVAASNNSTSSIVQSYTTDGTVQPGMIVGLNQKHTNQVQALTESQASSIFGVAISPTNAPITLSGNSTNTQVYVATSGRYDVLVSTQDGAIKVGDYISISALNGIGMKADSNELVVIGRSAASFNGTGSVLSTVKLKNNNGSTTTVTIGAIPVDINIEGNPTESAAAGRLPRLLQTAGSSIANKPVSAARVYTGMVILILTAVLSGGILYGGVRTSLISIGRNPLARRSIGRGLIQVVLTSLIIFILGLLGVYLLLRL